MTTREFRAFLLCVLGLFAALITASAFALAPDTAQSMPAGAALDALDTLLFVSIVCAGIPITAGLWLTLESEPD